MYAVRLHQSRHEKIDEVVKTRRKVKQGELLFGNGDAFSSLFAIRTGFLNQHFY